MHLKMYFSVPDTSGAYFEQMFLLGFVKSTHPHDSEGLKHYIYSSNHKKQSLIIIKLKNFKEI